MDGQIEQKQRNGAPHAHAVCFFREAEYPVDRIATYVHLGLAEGAAVVFATPAHLALVRSALGALGTDVDARTADGTLVLGDAEQMARAIGGGGDANRDVFDEQIAASVHRLVERHHHLRAYGEIVDVLAQSGAASIAVTLERWWNELLRDQPIELLCGYSLLSFATATSMAAFRAVCHEHDTVEPAWPDQRLNARGTSQSAAGAFEARSMAHTAAEHLARVQRFTSELSETSGLEALVGVVIAELENTFDADVALIALAGDDAETLRVYSRNAARSDRIESATLIASNSGLPIAAAFRRAEPLWLTAPSALARAYPQPPSNESRHQSRDDLRPAVQAAGAVPLRVHGRRLGAIGIVYHRSVEMPPAVRALIDDYALQVALALDRALAHDTAHAVRLRLQLLADTIACIAQAKLDPQQIISAMARELTRAGFAQRCSIELRGPDGAMLVADEGVLRGEHTQASEVIVPLQTTSEIFGTVSVVRPLGQPAFSADDKHLLRDLSDRAALFIENALLYERSRLERERTEAERLRAEAANRAKDEFLAMLGHELRNPLSPIRTAVHLMRLRNPGLMVRERTIIERQVDHMVRLVDDLLDVSRITRGKVELKRAPVDLTQIVADAVEIASPLLEERAHELRTSVPHDSLIVFGDANRLAQVIANLLTNAAKYTPPRGRIEVRATVDAGRVRLAVRDNGNGIDPELMPRLFDLFMQGKQASDRQKGGLGLGLAIARNIVEMHGGTLRAVSDGPGKGSEFTLELPLLAARDAETVQAPGPAPAPEAPAVGRRVLIVDDNTDAADLIADALQSLGHLTQVAYDGPSALQVAGAFRPELALLDIGLPVMDGYELGRRLSIVPGCEQVKLVALTGYGQTTDRERSREAGFDEHLVKPIDLERILNVIDQL